MLAPAPGLHVAGPTPAERRLTWAVILGSLTVFWYGVAVGVNALWSLVTG